jgi:lysophospholipase L1-like esterase
MRAARVRIGVSVTVIGLSVIVGLVLAEVVARLKFPPPTRHYVWPPDATLEFRPDRSVIAGVGDVARYAMNSWGVRGEEPTAGGEPRILMIGGSAVECIYLDQAKSFPALAEARINARAGGRRVWIGNAGKSGLNSKDHVRQLGDLLADYPGIDAVMVMTGVNDLGAALRADDPREFARPVPEATLRSRIYYAYPEIRAAAPFIRRAGLWQVARRAGLLRERLFPSEKVRETATGAIVATWRAHRRSAPRVRETIPDLAPVLAAQRGTLGAMVDLARARGTRLILVSQPAIWRADLPRDLADLLWMGGVGTYMEEPGHEYYSPGALARALDSFNGTLLSVARERGVEALDLAAMIPRDAGVFFDDCHFHEAGAARVADRIADYLTGSGRLAAIEPRTLAAN